MAVQPRLRESAFYPYAENREGARDMSRDSAYWGGARPRPTNSAHWGGARPRTNTSNPQVEYHHDEDPRRSHRRMSWNDPIQNVRNIEASSDNMSDETLVLPPETRRDYQSHAWEPMRMSERERDQYTRFRMMMPADNEVMYPYRPTPRHATRIPEVPPHFNVSPNRRFLLDYLMNSPRYESPYLLDPMMSHPLYDSDEVMAGSAYDMSQSGSRTSGRSSSRLVRCDNCSNDNSVRNDFCGFCRHRLTHHRDESSHTSQSYQRSDRSDINDLARIWREGQRELLDAQSAPKITIPIYDGDPAKFDKFWNAFTQMVDVKKLSDMNKLTQLYQHTEGMAQTIVEPYLNYTDAERGYSEAKRELYRRCGNPMLVATASLERITDGPQIGTSDVPALEVFVSALRGVQSSFQRLHLTNELSGYQTMRKLCKRLPQYMQNFWHKFIAERQFQNFNYQPSFKDFLQFMELQLFQKTLPGYVTDSRFQKDKEKEKDKDDRKRGGRPQARSTSAPAGADGGAAAMPNDRNDRDRDRVVRKPCPACEKAGKGSVYDHRMKNCEHFKKLSQDDRLNLVLANRYCFNCVSYDNHSAKDCKSPKNKCGVDGCDKNHHSLIHAAHLRMLDRIRESRLRGRDSRADRGPDTRGRDHSPRARDRHDNRGDSRRDNRDDNRRDNRRDDRRDNHRDDRRDNRRDDRRDNHRDDRRDNRPEDRANDRRGSESRHEARHTRQNEDDFEESSMPIQEAEDNRVSEATQTRSQARTSVVPKQAMKRNANGSQRLQYTCGMQVILVANQDSDIYEEAVAYLDDGANCCHVASTLQRRLGIVDNKQTGAIITATGLIEEVFTPAKIKIKGLTTKMKPEQIAVRCVEHYPCAEIAYINTNKFPELANIDFGPRTAGRLTEITLGTNCFASTVVIEEVAMGPNKPIAKRNLLGWYLTGCTGEDQQE